MVEKHTGYLKAVPLNQFRIHIRTGEREQKYAILAFDDKKHELFNVSYDWDEPEA